MDLFPFSFFFFLIYLAFIFLLLKELPSKKQYNALLKNI